LRFSRGCILLVRTTDGPADGSAALSPGTYPTGDDQDLDLACIEVSRSPGRDEVVVTTRADRDAGVKRVVAWLESLGGVVVERK
jgi:hypothetical protein